jgi:hypothetical protein
MLSKPMIFQRIEIVQRILHGDTNYATPGSAKITDVSGDVQMRGVRM